MNARIDAAAAPVHPGPPVQALVWIGGNLVSGGGNLLDEMLTRAGFANQAKHYGLQFTGTLPVETVVADPPRVMLIPDEPGRDSSSRAAQLRAAILKHSGKVEQARFPRSLVNCGGPVIVKAMARLRQVRRSIKP
jgi:iron complex transport system substrate-binding protein